MQKNMIRKAVSKLKHGKVIAYPTEAVFGLGCDPFNERAVLKILELKQRQADKGLILIASSWEQIKELTQPLSNEILKKAFDTWPGPYTWIFPKSAKVPSWISGKFNSVALRVTAHPIAKAICDLYGGPIVSTSANVEGEKPAKASTEIRQQFPRKIDYIVDADVGDLALPTTIRDILTDNALR